MSWLPVTNLGLNFSLIYLRRSICHKSVLRGSCYGPINTALGMDHMNWKFFVWSISASVNFWFHSQILATIAPLLN
jgi:hypothetical protein